MISKSRAIDIRRTCPYTCRASSASWVTFHCSSAYSNTIESELERLKDRSVLNAMEWRELGCRWASKGKCSVQPHLREPIAPNSLHVVNSLRIFFGKFA